jgi:hypothetical protein
MIVVTLVAPAIMMRAAQAMSSERLQTTQQFRIALEQNRYLPPAFLRGEELNLC